MALPLADMFLENACVSSVLHDKAGMYHSATKVNYLSLQILEIRESPSGFTPVTAVFRLAATGSDRLGFGRLAEPAGLPLEPVQTG
jgi:hypothetical protein